MGMPLAWSLKSALGRSRSDAFASMWQGVHTLAIAAVALRVAVACWFEQFDHPDALFQYLEQAHRLVYGYGFVPWEYRFGIRNWLLPGALAGLLAFFRLLGLSQPTLYVPLLKSTFAIVSVSVVYAGYVTGRNVFGEQTGRLAAVFATFWYELISCSVLATPEALGNILSLALLRSFPARPVEQAQNSAETGMPRDGHGEVRVFRRPRSPYWWYDFYVGNVRYCESSKQTDEAAAQVVAEARRDLAASGRSREADLAAARAIIKKYAPAVHAVVDPSAWEALAGAIFDALEAERARSHVRPSTKRGNR
jgi:hypothetical protein